MVSTSMVSSKARALVYSDRGEAADVSRRRAESTRVESSPNYSTYSLHSGVPLRDQTNAVAKTCTIIVEHARLT